MNTQTLTPDPTITAATFAFGAPALAKALPALEQIPSQFRLAGNPWHDLAHHLVDQGIGFSHQFIPHPGIDAKVALRHLGAIVQSMGESDAVVPMTAMLVSQWFAYARIDQLTAATPH